MQVLGVFVLRKCNIRMSWCNGTDPCQHGTCYIHACYRNQHQWTHRKSIFHSWVSEIISSLKLIIGIYWNLFVVQLQPNIQGFTRRGLYHKRSWLRSRCIGSISIIRCSSFECSDHSQSLCN